MAKRDRVTVVIDGGISMAIEATRDGGVIHIEEEPESTVFEERSRTGAVIRKLEVRDTEIVAVITDNSRQNPIVIETP